MSSVERPLPAITINVNQGLNFSSPTKYLTLRLAVLYLSHFEGDAQGIERR